MVLRVRSTAGFRYLGPLLALIAAAGGGGTSEGAKFCNDWATAFCQKLYDCTPADIGGPDFLGGSSQSECNNIGATPAATSRPQASRSTSTARVACT